MGAISFSIDTDLVRFLAGYLPLEVFVETGTYKGDTVASVKPFFKEILSIELSEYYFRQAEERFRDCPGVAIVHGDAGEVLRETADQFNKRPALFWLDSHWCDSEAVAGQGQQCSLLEELDAIGRLDADSVIMVDDARLFLSPPGPPHNFMQWPDLSQILNAFQSLSDCHQPLIINDVIVFFPERLSDYVKQYAHFKGVDWLEIIDGYHQKGKLADAIKEKEEVIAALNQERALLVKEIEVKNREIGLKQKEINEIFQTAQERLHVIEQQQALKSSLESLIDEQNVRIESSLDSRLQIFREQVQALQEQVQALQEQVQALQEGQRRPSIIARTRQWLQPRIGVLHQYPPRPMKLPYRYGKERAKKDRQMPVVSIVTPSFNHGEFIERTIKSVISQNCPRLEYIIQDGGSTDETVDILKQYDQYFAGWTSKKDNGQADAINAGLQESTGDIMAYLNSDDLLLPGALSYVVNYFNKHPHMDVVYGHRILIDENDQEIGRWVIPPHDDSVLDWADYIPQETLFWRRRIWEKAGSYVDTDYQFAMDWELILRFRENGAKFVRLPRFLGAFRIHSHQKTSIEIDRQGETEMNRLRKRALGREYSDSEVNMNLKAYLRKQVFLNKLYRAGILRY